MERADALRVLDQVIAAGYSAELRATNVNEKSGAQYEVGVPVGYCPIGKLAHLQAVAESNAADTFFAVDTTPRPYVVISSPKRRPEYEDDEDADRG